MWSSPLPLVTAPLGAHWCMQMPPGRLTLTLGLKGAGILHWGPSNRWEMTFPQDVYVSSGSHEFVHHVHVRKLHLHLSHHDGRHDDVQVLDKYFSIWRLNLYRQALEDSVLSETSFQGFWDWSQWAWCEHPRSEAGVHLGQPGQCRPGNVQVSHNGSSPHPCLWLARLRWSPSESRGGGWGTWHGGVTPTPLFEHLVYSHVLWCLSNRENMKVKNGV